jgi:hypothetical protein
MLSGNPARRSKKYPVGQGSQGELAERATQWSCLRYSAGKPGYDDNGKVIIISCTSTALLTFI